MKNITLRVGKNGKVEYSLELTETERKVLILLLRGVKPGGVINFANGK